MSSASPDSSSCGGDRAGSSRRHGELHRAFGPGAVIVRTFDLHLRVAISGVDQPQPALLRHVLAGIEYRDVVVPRFNLRDDIVDARHEAVSSADEGERQDVEIGLELEPPVALTVADSARESLVRIPRFEVLGIEVPARVRTDGEGDCCGLIAVVVDGEDLHLAGLIRAVDDPNESHERIVSRRQDERQGILGRPNRLNERSETEQWNAGEAQPWASGEDLLHRSTSGMTGSPLSLGRECILRSTLRIARRARAGPAHRRAPLRHTASHSHSTEVSRIDLHGFHRDNFDASDFLL